MHNTYTLQQKIGMVALAFFMLAGFLLVAHGDFITAF